MKSQSPNGTDPEPNLVQQLQNDADEERKWQAHRQTLQQQYQRAFTQLESIRRFQADQKREDQEYDLEDDTKEPRHDEEETRAWWDSSPLGAFRGKS